MSGARLRAFGALTGGLAAVVGCAHLSNYGPVAAPSDSPGTSASPGSTPSSGPSGDCAISTLDPNATIVVSIDPDFTAQTTSYGSIFGYAQYDPTGTGSIPTSAAVISATTSDLVVFANYDPNVVAHSAVGFGSVSAFPAEPYSFATSSGSAEGTTISTAAWSTGPLESFGNTSSTVCYSQTFSLPSTGTFYFGDDPLYNSASSYRDVIVVSAGASAHSRRTIKRRLH